MEKPEYQPNILQAILLLLLYCFVFSLVPGLFFLALSQVLGFNANDLLLDAATTMIGFTILLFWIRRRHRIDYRALLTVKQLKIGYILPMLMMVTGAVIILSEIDNLLRVFLPMNEYWAQVFGELSGALAGTDPAGLWKFVLVAVIIAPVVEEMLFRGVILKGFIKHYSPHRAIAVSALLFGIAHLNPWQFWTGVIWGSIAGWWYYETCSLVPGILGHALVNSLSIIAINFLGIKIPGFTIYNQSNTYQPLWFDLMGIGLLVLGVWILIRMFRRKRPGFNGLNEC